MVGVVLVMMSAVVGRSCVSVWCEVDGDGVSVVSPVLVGFGRVVVDG